MADIKKIYTTTTGTAEAYCWLQKPDTKFNARGVYKVDLTMKDSKAVRGLIDEINRIHEESYAEKVEEFNENPPVARKGKAVLKPYEGNLPYFENDDGTVTFKFSCYGSYTDKKTGENRDIPLKVFDSKGKPIADVPNISGGSELKVKFTMIPYGWTSVAGASVKLQLSSVMLVTLKEFGASSGDDWADEVEEDGYVDFKSKTKAKEQEWSEDYEDKNIEDEEEDF